MSENPSEHNNDEERLPETRSQLGGGNWLPPILVTGPESGDDDDFQQAYDNFHKTYPEYVAQSVEINRRLMEIGPLLARGLYSEAIGLAEDIPSDLLDWFLSHHRIYPQVAMLAKQMDLEPPPELELAIATELNNAYAREDDLKQLLRAYRRLPLLGGTRKERIHVLKLLVEHDPDRDIWAIELEKLEQDEGCVK